MGKYLELLRIFLNEKRNKKEKRKKKEKRTKNILLHTMIWLCTMINDYVLSLEQKTDYFHKNINTKDK